MDLDSLGRQCKWNNYGCGCYQWSHAHFLWLPSLGLMRICTHAGEGSADMVHGEQMMAARRCLWSVFASHGSIDALSLALLENASNFCLQIVLLQEAGPVACNPGTCNPGIVLNLLYWAAAMWNVFEWCKCCQGEQPWVSIDVVSIHLNVVRAIMGCWLLFNQYRCRFVSCV